MQHIVSYLDIQLDQCFKEPEDLCWKKELGKPISEPL